MPVSNRSALVIAAALVAGCFQPAGADPQPAGATEADDEGESSDTDAEPESESESDETDDGDNTVPCPYCRRHIHEDAQRCPYCENYISEEDAETPATPKPLWIIIGTLLCFVVIYLWIRYG